MFLCGYVHLETYIHERNYIFTRYPNSSVSPLLLRFWFFGVTPKRIWFMSAYPILSHLGALILVNILLVLQANNLHHGICHKLCFSFASYWACEFICFCVLEDTGGVRIPCLYTLYSNTIILNCVQILWSCSIFFKILFCSNHNILCLFG